MLHFRLRLPLVNRVLLVVIVILNTYVIAAPFIPGLLTSGDVPASRRQGLEQKIARPSVASTPQVLHANQVVIPSIGLEQAIYDGPVSQTYANLDKGVWRWPLSSSPNLGGNTVLLGHRFTYTQPRGVFYFLDRVKVDDPVGMWWNNTLHHYHVASSSVVSPADTAIENPTPDARLTIFTCTPLWLPDERLVIVAKEDKI